LRRQLCQTGSSLGPARSWQRTISLWITALALAHRRHAYPGGHLAARSIARSVWRSRQPPFEGERRAESSVEAHRPEESIKRASPCCETLAASFSRARRGPAPRARIALLAISAHQAFEVTWPISLTTAIELWRPLVSRKHRARDRSARSEYCDRRSLEHGVRTELTRNPGRTKQTR
jgi:hypothetical protein